MLISELIERLGEIYRTSGDMLVVDSYNDEHIAD